MSMVRRKRRQETLFVATAELARSPGHPVYRKLNELLAEAEFDRWIEGRCEQYYEAADKPGRVSLPPGTFFRMLLVGYFEGIESQRGIAGRCSDSLSLHEFLNYGPQEATLDHSTLRGSGCHRRSSTRCFSSSKDCRRAAIARREDGRRR